MQVQESRPEAHPDIVQNVVDIVTHYSIGDLDFGSQQDTATFEKPPEVGKCAP